MSQSQYVTTGTRKVDLQSVVKLARYFRYGKSSCITPADNVWHSKKRISKILKIPYYRVFDLLPDFEKAHDDQPGSLKNSRRHQRLSSTQEQTLVSFNKLKSQLGLSLRQRVDLLNFEGSFPKLSASVLRGVY
jgi:hypothetical protein